MIRVRIRDTVIGLYSCNVYGTFIVLACLICLHGSCVYLPINKILVLFRQVLNLTEPMMTS